MWLRYRLYHASATQIKNDLRNNLQSRAEQGDREAAIDLAIWFYIWEPLEVIAKYDQQAKQILELLTGDDTDLFDPSAPGYLCQLWLFQLGIGVIGSS